MTDTPEPEPSRTETDEPTATNDDDRDTIVELRDGDRLSGVTIQATPLNPSTELPTHERLVCPACKDTILLPIGRAGEATAEDRVFCECDEQEQGIRMHRIPGPAGEVSL